MFQLSSSSGAQQVTNVGPTAQHMPMPQTDASGFSVGGQQPWFPTGNQNVQSGLPIQPAVEQSAGPAGEQTWFSTGTQNIKPVTPLQESAQQNAVAQQWFPNSGQNVQPGAASQQSEERSAGVVSLMRIYFDFSFYFSVVTIIISSIFLILYQL